MTLAQQASVIVEAAKQELLRTDGILRWVDSTIVSLEHPPSWLIELSTLNPADLQDFIGILREHSDQQPPPLHLRIQVIILGWKAGIVSLQSSLQKLFILIVEGSDTKVNEDLLDRKLSDALADWDQLEEPNSIDSTLSSKFEIIFDEYLKDAAEVAGVLGWKYGS
jgi:hypothetical protein